MPLFSIITPTYNRAKLIGNMIESVIAQNYSDWELIIVDDGSTDDTSHFVDKYLRDSRVKYLKKENSGAAHSRNVGAQHAKGEYLTFLDSDDIVLSEWLQVVAQNLKGNTGIVSTGARRKFTSGLMIEEKPYYFNLKNGGFNVKFTAGSLFIRKELFLSIGGYDSKLSCSHHTDLGYRLLMLWEQNPFDIVTIDSCLVIINVHDGYRIRTDWNKVQHGTTGFVNKHLKFLKENNPISLSNSYAVIAHAHSKLGNRLDSIKYTFLAIKSRPIYYKNYLRIFKYLV